MLRVLIEVEQPTGAMRKLLLRPGQQLDFGSSAYAHVALRDDAALSATHFRVRADREACYLQDLDSSNGTFVNDAPVESIVLRDGDRITAGKSHFRVHIEGGVPSEPIDRPLVSHRLSPEPEGATGSCPASFTFETCSSGVTVCRGSSDEISPAALAARLGRIWPLFLVVDFHKQDELVLAASETSPYLINWLGDEVAAGMSPRFLAASEVPQWVEILEQGWAADAVECIFASEEAADVLAHLRRMVRGGDGSARAILGCCWPSVLGPLLSSSPDASRRILNGIEAALVESTDDPGQWEIYGSEQLTEILQKVGLQVLEPAIHGSQTSDGSAA